MIAERELDFEPSDGSQPQKVTVRFGMPVTDDEGDNWRVSIEIIGPAPGQVFRKDAWGVDSTQALVEALWLAPVFLSTIAADAAGRLTFLGDAELGFYRPPPES
jgi:hypothetical protein